MIASIASMVVLAFAVSLDGFGVGVTYGLRRIRIPFLSVLIIACCSGLIIWLSMQAGSWLTEYLSELAARVLGACILIVIGCWALYQLKRGRQEDDQIGSNSQAKVEVNQMDVQARHHDPEAAPIVMLELKTLGLVIQILRTPQAADVDKSGIISSSEAIMLGVALSLDAFGAGIGAAMLGLPALLTALLIASASALFLVGGTKLGLRFSTWRGMQILSFLPGILLIMMGIMKLL